MGIKKHMLISNQLKRCKKTLAKKVFNEKVIEKWKAKIKRNGSKKRKTYFQNVSYNPILHLSPVWEAPFLSKKVKSLYTTVVCTVHVLLFRMRQKAL